MKDQRLSFRKIANLNFDTLYGAQYKMEFVKTELLRVNLMIWILSAGALTGLSALVFLREGEVYEFISGSIGYFFIIFSGMIIYEIISRRYTIYRIKQNQRLQKWFSLINLIVETSFPTIIIAMFALRMTSIVVYISPFILLYSLFIIQSILHLNFWEALLTSIVAAIEYFLAANLIPGMSPSSESIPELVSSETLIVIRMLFILLCGIVSGWVAVEVKRRIVETYQTIGERNRIRQMFNQQVSAEIVDQIIKEGTEIKSKHMPVCIMFLDVRDFTPFAATKTPEEVLDFQNKLFGKEIKIIEKYHGVINQILGDGFMATFGAPVAVGNSCENAVKAGFEILKETQQACDNKLLPPTRLGIGLQYGEAITGNIGIEDRKQFSVVGNVVIQASRIEQLNKQFRSEFLASKAVMQQVSDSALPRGESVGPVPLKGVAEPVEIIRLK
jgi:adenylate cyclase